MLTKYSYVNGNKVRYLESGNSKDTILLVHGLGASAERWEFVMPLFSRDYRVIVPDLIGFGFSDKPLVDYTMEFFSDFLTGFIKELALDSFNLIGSSLGGQVAAEYTSQKNNLAKKLVLVSPSGIMKHSTPALDAYVMAALYPNQEGAQSAFKMMTGKSDEINPKIIEGFVSRMSMPNAKMAFMSTILGLKNSDVITPKLKQISSPTLIVWGDLDPVIPIKYANDFVSSIQDCRFYRMDGTGHTPYVDEPEKFYDVVFEFIKE